MLIIKLVIITFSSEELHNNEEKAEIIGINIYNGQDLVPIRTVEAIWELGKRYGSEGKDFEIAWGDACGSKEKGCYHVEWE